MKSSEKFFLDERGVSSPLDLDDTELLQYLRRFCPWGGDVFVVAEDGTDQDRALALKLSREALASGDTVSVWRRMDDDGFVDTHAPSEFKLSLS